MQYSLSALFLLRNVFADAFRGFPGAYEIDKQTYGNVKEVRKYDLKG